jgi:4-hydroxy-tetrahydrodipicolinate synthase
VKAPSIDCDWVRKALSGPISGLHPPFHRDGSLDFDGLRREIDHNIDAGSGVLLMTYWDGLHSLLTDAEVAEVLRVVIHQVRRRALVVAADRQWSTGKEIEFADFAREAGADVLMVLPPHWAGSVTHDSLVGHYRAVSEHIPVMPVTGLFSAQRALGLRVIRSLVDEVPNIVAIKDDIGGEFARRVALMAHERWAVLSGGLKQDHLSLHPYGCDGYMSWYLHFIPEIAHAYWRTIEAGDLAASARIIRDYDYLWFDFSETLGGGFDAMYHGAQEVFGIAGRWRRPPYQSLTDAEMERLQGFFASLPPIASIASPI